MAEVTLQSLADQLAEFQAGAAAFQTAVINRFDNIDAVLRQTRSDLHMMDVRLSSMEARFSALESRFSALEARFDWVAGRLERHDQRLEKLDGLPA